MTLSELCIRRPVMTTLITASIIAFGVFGFRLLPVSALPKVDFPTIAVTATLPGASADTMAASVAGIIERQLSTIAGISSMSSNSSQGTSVITIQFDLNRNIDAAALDVQTALTIAQRRLPIEMTIPPSFRKVNPADFPVLFVSLGSATLPLSAVNEYGDITIGQALSQLPGVAQVLIYGAQKFAIRVQADPEAAAARGVSMEDIRAAVSRANSSTPVGTLNGPKQDVALQASGQMDKAADYRQIYVAWRNGSPVRLDEIAKVYDSVENDKIATWMNDERAIVLAIQKQPDANTVAVVDAVLAKLPSLRAAIPPSVTMQVMMDRSVSIRQAVSDVEETLLIAIALVILVIFLFLRSASATFIPALAVPISLFGTCAAMYALDYSINNMTLLALTLSVGFVVDDAIVMLENITRYVEQGERPLAAALRGAGEIGFTILSISISLVAVLIPLLLMGGVIGRLFREFAVTLAMAIFVSLVVSLTLTPMMASRFLRAHGETRHGRLYQWSEAAFDRMLHGYERGLDLALSWSRTTLCIFFATLALSVYLFVIIPKGFFPQQDNGFLNAVSEMAQDISFADMKQHQEELSRIVRADPAVDSMAEFIGGGGTALNSGRMYITLKPHEERDADAQQIIARLRPKLEAVEGARLYMQASQDVRLGGRATRTQFEYTLQDANLAELNEWAPKILAKMKTLPQLRDVATDQQTEGTTLTMTFDRDTASRYGIQPQLIDDTLYDAFGQRQVAQYFTQLNSYHVILEILPELQGKLDTLNKLYIKSPTTGDEVPLSVFCKWTTVPVRPLAIAHQGQFPATTISFNLGEGVALGQATDAIQNAVADLGAPATLSSSFQGTAQAFQQSLSSVPLLILAALVVVYLILGMLYESYIHPLTILSTLPSAGVGALAILMAFGFDFSLIALIGIILLIGIVKKNGIMMVDFAIAAEREEHLSPRESIRKAALLRFRPIMMTTMAALLGGVPLMLGTGTGAEIRQPLGYAMVGGLIVSQALTLFTTPVVYLYLDRFSNALSNWTATKRDDDDEPSVRNAAE